VKRHLVPVALAAWIVLAGAALYLAGRASAPAARKGNDVATLRAALDRVNDNLAQMDARLDRLEAARRPAPDPASGPARAGAAAPAATNMSMHTPASVADSEARAAQRLQAMQERLVEDPLSPQWARANEKVIDGFLAADNLRQRQLPIPDFERATCHSHLCRINLGFADDALASQTQEMLLQAIAPSLPHAWTFRLPRPDGTLELVVFAGDGVGDR
jgi:hypothetical protein